MLLHSMQCQRDRAGEAQNQRDSYRHLKRRQQDEVSAAVAIAAAVAASAGQYLAALFEFGWLSAWRPTGP